MTCICMAVDTATSEVVVNLGRGDRRVRCVTSSSGHLLARCWDSGHRRLSPGVCGNHLFVLLPADAWDNWGVAKSDLMKLHRTMGHGNFLVLVQRLKWRFLIVTCPSCGRLWRHFDAVLVRSGSGPQPGQWVRCPKNQNLSMRRAPIFGNCGRPVLHITCIFTRLRHCDVLGSKSATNVCHSLLHLQGKYYWPLLVLYTDLGRKLDSDPIRQGADRYGITLHCAPVGSHWSMIRVYRHHYQLQHTVVLVLESDESLSM